MKLKRRPLTSYSTIALLVLMLILAPVLSPHVQAQEAAGAAGSGSVEPPAGAAAGVGVSGPTPAPPSTGKGALAPPPQTAVPSEPDTEQTTEVVEVPKGIGASAGTAGVATAESGGGIALGWKIAGGVLGVGLLVGLLAGGGGSTPSH